MPTIQQIEAFKVKARSAGYNESQIAAEIARKQQEENNTALQTQRTQTQVQSTTKPTPQPKPSTLSKIGTGAVNLVKGVFNGPTRLGEAVGNAAAMPAAQKQNQQIEDQALQTVNQLNSKADQAERTGNKAQAQRLRKLAQENLKLVNKNSKALAATADKAAEDAIKGGVGTAALFVPGGKTPLTRIAAGTASGAMSGYGASAKGDELGSTVGGAVIGGVASGALEGAGALVKKIKGTAGKNAVTKAGDAMREDVRHIRVKPSIYGASKEKAINKTLDELKITGTPQRQYERLLPAMEDLSSQIDDALNKKPGSVESKSLVDQFFTKLKSALRTSDLNKKQIQNTINEYVHDLYSAASGGKELAGKISNKELYQLKKIAFEDYARAFAKQQAGQALTPKEEVAMKAWSVIDDALKQLNPEVKKLTTMQSHLYQAAPSLQSARNTVSTTRAFGTTIPAPVKNAVQDKAGGVLQAAGSLPSKIPTGNIPDVVKNTGISVASNVLSGNGLDSPTDASQEENTQIEQTDQGSGDQANDQQGSEHTDNISQIDTTLQTHPIFGNLTKQEVLLDAFKKGLTQKELTELETIYDKFAPQDQMSDEVLTKLLEKRKLFTEQGLSTETIDAQLQKMGIIPSGGPTGKLTEIQQAREDVKSLTDYALDQLDTANPKTGPIEPGIENVKAIFNAGDEATLEFGNTIAQIKATLAKARAGTSFTPNEEKLLDKYAPKEGDSEQQLRTKLNGLKNFFKNRKFTDKQKE